MHAQALKETAASSPAGTMPATASGGAAAATPVPLRLSLAGSPSQVDQEARSSPLRLLAAWPCLRLCETCTWTLEHIPAVLLQAAAAEDQSPEMAAKANLKEHDQQEKLAQKVQS